MKRLVFSEYMEWAKLHSESAYNLASSGVRPLPLRNLPITLADLEITGPSTYGYEPLQNAIARYCKITANRVMAATGTSMANHLAMAVCIEPGDDVLIEHPTYELLISTARYLGAQVKRFQRTYEDGFRVAPEAIARTITPQTRLIVLTNLHNPSGVMTETATLHAIGEIALRHGCKVLVDEVYLEAAFEHRQPPAALLGEHFITTSSLTKAFGLGGLRCGWVLAEPNLIKQMWRLNDLFGVVPAHLAERASVTAFANIDSLAKRSRTLLSENRKQWETFLAAHQMISAIQSEHAIIAFPKLIDGNVDDFCVRLREHFDTTVAPGRFFEMPNHFRIAMGGEPAIFAAGLKRLGEALAEHAATVQRS